MIHKHVANRYDSIRDDGRRVTMQQIACQEVRCQLPKGHATSCAWQSVTCHECLKIMLQEFIERASFCKYALKTTPYVKPEGFRFPKLVRGKREPRFAADPEILRRLEVE